MGIAAVALALALIASTGELTPARAGDADAFPGTFLGDRSFGELDYTGSTVQDGEPVGCFGPLTSTVWFWHRSDEPAPMRFFAGTEDPFLPSVTVWDDNGQPDSGLLTGVGCSFEGQIKPTLPSTNESHAYFRSQPGHTYYIQVGRAGASLGVLRYGLEEVEQLAADEIQNAQQLNEGVVYRELDLFGATAGQDEPQAECVKYGGATRLSFTYWFRFDPGDEPRNLIVEAIAADFVPTLVVWSGANGEAEIGCGTNTVGFRAEPNTTYFVQVGLITPLNGLLFAGFVDLLVHGFDDLVCPGVSETYTDKRFDSHGQGPPADMVKLDLAVGVDVTCLTFTYDQGLSTTYDYSDVLDTNVYVDSLTHSGPQYPLTFCPVDVPFEDDSHVFFASGLGENVAAIFLASYWSHPEPKPWAIFELGQNSITVMALTKDVGDGYAFRLKAVSGNPIELSECMPDSGVLAFGEAVNPFTGDLDCNTLVEGKDILPILALIVELQGSRAGCPELGQKVQSQSSLGGLVSVDDYGDFNCDSQITLLDVLALLDWLGSDPEGREGHCQQADDRVFDEQSLPATAAP
jgi:hypothetical protein